MVERPSLRNSGRRSGGTAPSQIPFVRPRHTDDRHVEEFAAAMRDKLALKRAEGRGGWEDKDHCSNEHLSRLLHEHIAKGDPVDVANFAMMIHQRGERIGDDPGSAELERQLSEAVERAKGFEEQAAICAKITEATERERDEARELAANFTQVEKFTAMQTRATAAEARADTLAGEVETYRKACEDWQTTAADASGDAAVLRTAILAVVSAVRAYLPPDGIDPLACLSLVLAAVDNPTINPLIEQAERAALQGEPTPKTQPAMSWPNGCHSPNSCTRHRACMYFGCHHEGQDIKPEIEAALRASHKQEEPKP